ncbi:MAG: hypothetical protein LBK60_11625 [Verrucomicrobiales bacterium]|jgi:hypothetical protein|nr:hypothetical protein [Verrucomicrobiales bacterium]
MTRLLFRLVWSSLALLFPGAPLFAQGSPLTLTPSATQPPAFAPADGQDIAEIRGIWVPQYQQYFWKALIIVAALVIGGGLVWWLARWYKSRKPTLTLYQIIMQKLEQCRLLIAAGNARLFSGEVSDIVRGYLEQRFTVPSTHQTTDEFIRSATQHANSELEPFLPQLKDFLGYCDMAKFAREELDVEQMTLMLASAGNFVEATKALERDADGEAAV